MLSHFPEKDRLLRCMTEQSSQCQQVDHADQAKSSEAAKVGPWPMTPSCYRPESRLPGSTAQEKGEGMRGRRVLMESLMSHGVRLIFGNPGTTETPLLDSLLAYPQIDYVMTLHEGVAVGAASFYAQASGRTPVANLHVAPGLGNAIGSLYGALKADSPLVVTAGQQDTRMRLTNPLLSHDLVSMAAPVTKWSVQVERADEIAPILRRAFKVATDQPAGPVFVSLPIDALEQETSVEPVAPDRLWRCTQPDPKGIGEVASLLLKSASPVIIAGDDIARSRAEGELVGLAEAIGASVWF